MFITYCMYIEVLHATCNNDKAVFDYCWTSFTALGGMMMACVA